MKRKLIQMVHCEMTDIKDKELIKDLIYTFDYLKEKYPNTEYLLIEDFINPHPLYCSHKVEKVCRFAPSNYEPQNCSWSEGLKLAIYDKDNLVDLLEEKNEKGN